MTKSELKQKLEAIGKVIANKYSEKSSPFVYYGYLELLPLLLDAYEALESASFQLDDDSPLTAQNILSDSIARIEAFANGEK